MSKRASTLRRERTRFEWIVLAVSLAAISAIAGGLIFFGATVESGPPELRPALRPEGVHFVLTVENAGGTTAEEVIVEVSRGEEKAEVEFRAVPKGDTEEALVSIGGQGEPTVQVLHYKEP